MKKHNGNKAADTKGWFGHWSNVYDRTLGSISFHRGLLDLVVRNARVKNGDKILDLGCGTGLLSLKCLQKARCAVMGADYSKEMLGILKDKIKKLKLSDRISLCLMDAASLKFKDRTFDKVVSSVALHHLTDKLPALKRIRRVLKPGGLFIIGEVDMDATGKHTDTKRLKRMLRVLEQEWIPALKDAGVEAFSTMFDNGKKHILNQGEYGLSLKQWARLCRKAGFVRVLVKRVPRHKVFGIVVAKKP
jgi:ubiquinone/menaquinone biosynthesis C-methylase UbiE